MLDFNLKPAPDARCPMCRAILLDVSGKHEFRMFPPKEVTNDFFGDGSNIDATYYPTPAVQQFTAAFAPCGCKWEARVGSKELQLYVLYIIHTDAGSTFEFGHRQHDSKYAMYIMTTARG